MYNNTFFFFWYIIFLFLFLHMQQLSIFSLDCHLFILRTIHFFLLKYINDGLFPILP